MDKDCRAQDWLALPLLPYRETPSAAPAPATCRLNSAKDARTVHGESTVISLSFGTDHAFNLVQFYL